MLIIMWFTITFTITPQIVIHKNPFYKFWAVNDSVPNMRLTQTSKYVGISIALESLTKPRTSLQHKEDCGFTQHLGSQTQREDEPPWSCVVGRSWQSLKGRVRGGIRFCLPLNHCALILPYCQHLSYSNDPSVPHKALRHGYNRCVRNTTHSWKDGKCCTFILS